MIEHKWFFYQLSLFAKLVESGGFTQAAKSCGHSKSGISQHMAQLENYLGVQLIDRSTRKLKLTSAGKKTLKHSLTLNRLAEQTLTDVLTTDEELSGGFSIQAPAALMKSVISPAIVQLTQEFQQIKPNISLQESSQPLQSQDKAADIILHTRHFTDDRYHVEKIGEIKSVLVASPAWIKHIDKPMQITDLSGCDFIAAQWQPASMEYKFRGIQNEVVGLRFNTACQVSDLELAVRLCCEGTGFALLPEFAIRDACKDGRLMKLFRTYQYPPADLFMAYYHHSNLAMVQRRFKDIIRAQQAYI
ncbi:LysR family transcriptional regulator [Marinicella sp. W31]|uniref:LysR family transcriptional regulator n=1 Tax=Marinicella sp. W31 TaxID=3023713 RepID=UPI0037578275